MAKKTLLSWSSGKDSAWSLWQLQRDRRIDLRGIFCSLNSAADRVAMHGVRRQLLELQAEAIGLPLYIIELPSPCDNEQYLAAMSEFCEKAKKMGIEAFAFGDLYLEDIKQYRIDSLIDTGIEPLFPIWGEPTQRLSQEMVASGLKTILSCVDPKQIDRRFAGRHYDLELLAQLPTSADPCGENGEFHTFVYDGPMFKQTIPVQVGEQIERGGFVYCDILPSGSDEANC